MGTSIDWRIQKKVYVDGNFWGVLKQIPVFVGTPKSEDQTTDAGCKFSATWTDLKVDPFVKAVL